MIKRIFSLALAVFATVPTIFNTNAVSENSHNPGWLLWHSYSEYSAMDSELFLRSPNGEITEISGDFTHPMNGDFGSSPTDIVFMAIDKAADEWDIYRYNSISGEVTNLTPNSGFRNEDPKFSPDGLKIVFKRGFWDNSRNDFTYNLAEINLVNGEISMLTDDTYEQSMPYYSTDGDYIYYSEYNGGISQISRLERESGEKEEIFAEKGVTAYYPVVYGESLYFAKWNTVDNRNDMIVCYDGKNITSMPFNSAEFNCSDPCPVSDTSMIYSSTKNGGYDLFYFDGDKSFPLDYANSEKNELGAAFYPYDEIKNYAADLHQFLLGADSPKRNYDTNGDGISNCYDMIYIRGLINSNAAIFMTAAFFVQLYYEVPL